MAFGLAGLRLGVRAVLYRRRLKSGVDTCTYFLPCPDLTLVALAANALPQCSDRGQMAV